MKKNDINKILDTSYLTTDDVKWIKNKRVFKKYIKAYYEELNKNTKNKKNINKKVINDDIEVLDFEEKINITDNDKIEILDFTKTIDVSKVSDINNAKEKARKKIILERNILYIIITSCIIGIIILTVMLLSRNNQSNDNEVIAKDIIKNVTTKKVSVNEEDIVVKNSDLYSKYINLNMLEVDFNDLINTNNDTKGWIKVNGTKVNYPFVQSGDNDYYLNHSYDKSYNVRGWVFLDYRCNIDYLNDNTILYAHGLKNNMMFGSLRNIIKESWYTNSDNHIISMATPSKSMLWQVFSSYTIEPESYYIKTNFNSSSEYIKFLNTLKSRSVYDYGIDLTESDKILTLSSCYDDNLRMVLHAKLIAIKEK